MKRAKLGTFPRLTLNSLRAISRELNFVEISTLFLILFTLYMFRQSFTEFIALTGFKESSSTRRLTMIIVNDVSNMALIVSTFKRPGGDMGATKTACGP